MELPTIEQAQEFLRTINVGREAIGLDPLKKLEFDECEPGNPHGCLSATNLFFDADLFTASTHVLGQIGSGGPAPLSEEAEALASVFGAKIVQVPMFDRVGFRIPDAIRVVTAPFDTELDGLDERLREAGVI